MEDIHIFPLCFCLELLCFFYSACVFLHLSVPIFFLSVPPCHHFSCQLKLEKVPLAFQIFLSLGSLFAVTLNPLSLLQ